MVREPVSKSGPKKKLVTALAAFGLLSAIGLVVAWELTKVYVMSRTDPDFQSFCAINEGMNCETVALSHFSTFMSVPVSVWGMAGYLFTLVLSLLGLMKRSDGFIHGCMLLLSLVFCLVSLFLVYVMSAIIRSLCILCLALDIINIGLLLMAILIVRSSGESFLAVVKHALGSWVRRPALPALVAVIGVSLLSSAWVYGRHVTRATPTEGVFQSLPEEEQLDLPEMWTSKTEITSNQEPSYEAPEEKSEVDGAVTPERAEEATPPKESEKKSEADRTIHMGVNEEGHNWIGAEEPILVIEEFTDYQCPYCRKAHMIVRKLLSKYPDKIRVVHRHFPLDQACNRIIERPFHPRACELSRIAVCAGQQGRFWEMNDFLFQHAFEIREKKLSAADIAQRLELDKEQFDSCMADETQFAGVKKDIEAAIELDLMGTPAYVIDGAIYYGKIPDEAVKQLASE